MSASVFMGVYTKDGLARNGSLFLRDNGPEDTLVELDCLAGDLVGDLGGRDDRELDLPVRREEDFDTCCGFDGGDLELLCES